MCELWQNRRLRSIQANLTWQQNWLKFPVQKFHCAWSVSCLNCWRLTTIYTSQFKVTSLISLIPDHEAPLDANNLQRKQKRTKTYLFRSNFQFVLLRAVETGWTRNREQLNYCSATYMRPCFYWVAEFPTASSQDEGARTTGAWWRDALAAANGAKSWTIGMNFGGIIIWRNIYGSISLVWIFIRDFHARAGSSA